mgnify:CR=1 FL=1
MIDRRPARAALAGLVALVCLYALGFGALAARAYPAHETSAFDLGNYTQALWNAAHGRGLQFTLAPEFGTTRWAVHVEPFLLLLVPVFRWITDDPRCLLWLQAVVIALGGWPLYGLARRRLGSDWAAVGLVLIYFLLPALEAVTLHEFHPVGLAPTWLLAAWYCLDRAWVAAGDEQGIWPGAHRPATPPPRRLGTPHPAAWLSALFFLLALSTKEDISLHVALSGLYLMALRRRWRAGLALTLAGAAWFYVATWLVLPANRPDGSHSAYLGFFSQLGDTPLEILLSPVRAPDKVWAMLSAPDTWRGVAMLTLPLAGVSLAGWPFLLLALPTLAIALFSSNPLMHQLETYHYAAPALAGVMLAGVEGVGRLASMVTHRLAARQAAGRSRLLHANPALGLVVIVLGASLIYHHYRGYSPLARAFRWPQVTAHHQLGDALLASIPPEAPVVTQAELAPQLARRPWLRIWQGPFDPNADYFFLDVTHPAFVNRKGAQEGLLSDMAQDPTVGLVAGEDGYLLLKKGAPRQAVRPEFFTFVYAEAPSAARPVAATFGQALHLVAFETERPSADREGEPLLTLYWQVAAALPEDYLISVFLLDAAGQPVGATLLQQPLTVWWPTSRWEVGRTVRLLANTFPWWTGDRSEFSYGVAVVRGRDPWQWAARLPVTRRDSGPAVLDGGTLLPLVTFRRIANIAYEW